MSFFSRLPRGSALILVLGFVLLSLVVAGNINGRALLYRPSSLYVMPGDAHLRFPYTEISVPNADQAFHYAWFLKPTTKKQTLVYFHDGAEALPNAEAHIHALVAAGYGALIVEYRGYGKEPGTPSEKLLYADMEDFFDFLRDVNVSPSNMVLMGQGIGAAIAVEMALRHKVGGVLLISPFTSAQNLLLEKMPRFLPSFFVTDRYDSLAKIDRIETPLLITAGDQDPLIPPRDAATLYGKANPRKMLHIFDQLGHYDVFAPAWTKLALDWLDGMADNVSGPLEKVKTYSSPDLNVLPPNLPIIPAPTP